MANKKHPRLPQNKKIYSKNDGSIVHCGKVLNDTDMRSIISLAISLSNDPLLVDIIEDIESEAAKKIYFDSKSIEDLSFGKGMIYAVDLLKRKIVNLSRMKQP